MTKAEDFDSIDDYNVFFREQAYQFREAEPGVFRLKLAITNPIDLLPFPKEYNTLDGILKNIDAICAIGAKGSHRFSTNNDFIADFMTGMRSIYHKKYVEKKAYRSNIVYEATADLREEKNITDCSGDFKFDPNPYIYIKPHDRFGYGAVYRMTEPEEADAGEYELCVKEGKWRRIDPESYEKTTENVQAARRFEAVSRSNPDFQEKYQELLSVDPLDSTGKYVVWASALVVRKALIKHYDDKHLHLITMDRHDGRYKSLKEVNRGKAHAKSPRITAPLSCLEDFLNIIQIVEYEKEQKAGLFGPKKLVRLLDALQERYDAGAVRYTKRMSSERTDKLEGMQAELMHMTMSMYNIEQKGLLALSEDGRRNMLDVVVPEERKIIPHPALSRLHPDDWRVKLEKAWRQQNSL